MPKVAEEEEAENEIKAETSGTAHEKLWQKFLV